MKFGADSAAVVPPCVVWEAKCVSGQFQMHIVQVAQFWAVILLALRCFGKLVGKNSHLKTHSGEKSNNCNGCDFAKFASSQASNFWTSWAILICRVRSPLPPKGLPTSHSTFSLSSLTENNHSLKLKGLKPQKERIHIRVVQTDLHAAPIQVLEYQM